MEHAPTGAYQGYIGWVDKIGSWWKGWIDDVAYYKSALNASTVKWHYETGSIDDLAYNPARSSERLTEDVDSAVLSTITVPAHKRAVLAERDPFKRPCWTTVRERPRRRSDDHGR